jgi:type III restriction enzyme
VKPAAPAPAPQPKFTKPEEVAAAKATIEAIAKVVRDPQIAPSPKALQSDEVQKKLVEAVKDKTLGRPAHALPGHEQADRRQLVLVVREATAVYNALTIAIPRVIVLPKGVVRAGFRDFSLDLSSFRLQPVSQEILVRHLESGAEHVIGALSGASTRSGSRTTSCAASSTSTT